MNVVFVLHSIMRLATYMLLIHALLSLTNDRLSTGLVLLCAAVSKFVMSEKRHIWWAQE